MVTDSKTALTEFMDQARGMMAVNPMLAPQMDQFQKARDGILDEAETFFEGWFERRHEAAQSALEAIRKVNGNGADPSVAMKTMMDWQQHSFQRLADDMQQWVELCSRCANRMTSAEVQAGQEAVKEVARQAKSATREKHATPV